MADFENPQIFSRLLQDFWISTHPIELKKIMALSQLIGNAQNFFKPHRTVQDLEKRVWRWVDYPENAQFD